MPIPECKAIMFPFLRVLEDGKDHHIRQIIDILAVNFHLNEIERKQFVPSGTEHLFDNRVRWSRKHLKDLGWLTDPYRGYVRITQQGQDALKSEIDSLKIIIPRQPTDNNNHTIKKIVEEQQKRTDSHIDENITPEESLAQSYSRIREHLARELIEKVVSLSPQFFERLVVELLVKMGYGGSLIDAGRAIGRTGDEGIDGVIKEDKLGLDVIYIQAKRWKPGNIVGRPEIHRFIGALAGQGAKKGVFITTSSFSRDAIDYAPKNETKIVLLDGEQLAQLMIDYDLGVSTQSVYQVKKIDLDYFDEE